MKTNPAHGNDEGRRVKNPELYLGAHSTLYGQNRH